MNTKHTKGEWTTGGISPFGAFGEDKPVKVDGIVMARVINYANEDEVNANARLIAAAPELLDALLQWQHAERENDEAEMANARFSRDSAIEQATGKGEAP